jgi:hypothetical protein
MPPISSHLGETPALVSLVERLYTSTDEGDAMSNGAWTNKLENLRDRVAETGTRSDRTRKNAGTNKSRTGDRIHRRTSSGAQGTAREGEGAKSNIRKQQRASLGSRAHARLTDMSKTREYSVAIADGGNTYANTGIHATDDADAFRQAKEWAGKQPHWEGAWLTLSIDGRGVRTLKPGEF